MDSGTVLVIALCIWAMCGAICTAIADAKNRSIGGWAALGFLFGPIAILIIAAATPLPPPSKTEPEKTNTIPTTSKSAPVSMIADELAKLADLKDRGALTEEEFAAQKARLIA